MRRITRAIVQRIALCKRGKNGLKTMFKSADGPESLELDTIVRKGSEEGSLLAVVYAPNLPDDDGHLADDAKVIERSAHEFLRDFRQLDIEHDGKVLPHEAAYVAESFIVGAGDERFADWKDYAGRPVDVTGGWAVRIQIDDPELRAAYRDGDWDGVSMFGLAATEPVSKSKAASQRVLDRLTSRSGDTQGENDMNEEQLKEMFKSLGDRLVEAISKAVVAPAPAKPEAKETEAETETEQDPIQAQIDALKKPEVPTDINSPTAMQAFADAQRAYELKVKQIRGELTSEQVAEMVKSMTNKLPSDEECGIEDSDSPRERELKRQLFEVKKSRNAPEEKPDTEQARVEEVRKARSKTASLISGSYNESVGTAPSRSFRTVKEGA